MTTIRRRIIQRSRIAIRSYLFRVRIEKRIVFIMKIESFLFDGQLRLLIGLADDNFANFLAVFFFDFLDQISAFVRQKLSKRKSIA